ncbi:hypothetical protein BN2476_20083 [Paraburkholderia piptadeniae]|uniref:Uncharacterized protein n=1 Tax=Paraburkholderia piptadeniae TaxID=1701573 RepID=A0A1N7RJD5_9BURK|nr:hypothetical protein BN2476_20083 [Paraburkholderia piptadeniae]
MDNSCRITAPSEQEAHLEFSYDQGNPAEVAQDSGNFIKIRVNIFEGGMANSRLFLLPKQFAALRRKRPKSMNSESTPSAAPTRSKASSRGRART